MLIKHATYFFCFCFYVPTYWNLWLRLCNTDTQYLLSHVRKFFDLDFLPLFPCHQEQLPILDTVIGYSGGSASLRSTDLQPLGVAVLFLSWDGPLVCVTFTLLCSLMVWGPDFRMLSSAELEWLQCLRVASAAAETEVRGTSPWKRCQPCSWIRTTWVR